MSEPYETMVQICKDLLKTENDLIANLSNISAIVKLHMNDCNWAGFYLKKEEQLVLGPFQGLPACIRIDMGRGVCGTSALKREILVVEDVHTFEGHIACDSNSNSEIVLPIIQKGEIFGVLDIDSPSVGRFGDEEKKYLSLIVVEIESFLNRAI